MVLVMLGVTSTLTAILVAAAFVVGGIAAAFTVWIDRWYAERVRRRAQSDRTVTAGRFDVVCTSAPARAAHLLAQWWDSQAPPVDPGPDATTRVEEATSGHQLSTAA
jgi:hypothetical protein